MKVDLSDLTNTDLLCLINFAIDELKNRNVSNVQNIQKINLNSIRPEDLN